MNKETIEITNKYLMKTYNRLPLSFERGEGAYLFDEDGNKYLDFVAGIAVNSIGYHNKNFIKVVSEQLGKICHSSNLYHIKQQSLLAKKLVQWSGLDKAFFCNSGAEANEAALKLARKYGYSKNKNNNCSKIIAMKNSFHGRTLGALSLTGQEKYQKAFKPLVSSMEYAQFNNLESVEELIDSSTCAVIIECIQGEGGVIPATKEFYEGVRKLCNKYNALMIVDEVQTGIARCGKYFCFQNFESKPDIICLAKALGGGIPIGAIVSSEKASACFEPGDHASTCGGNYIATCAALAVLSEIENNNLDKNAGVMGKYLTDELNKLKPLIKEVRGIGLMIGVQMDNPPSDIIKKCEEKGLLLIGAGTNTIRFVPPLIIDKTHIDEAVNIFKEALVEYSIKQQEK